MHERRRREAGVPRTARLAVGGPAGETTDFGVDHKFSPLEHMLLTTAVCTEMPAPPTGRALLPGGGVGHELSCAGGVPSSGERPLLALAPLCWLAPPLPHAPCALSPRMRGGPSARRRGGKVSPMKTGTDLSTIPQGLERHVTDKVLSAVWVWVTRERMISSKH